MQAGSRPRILVTNDDGIHAEGLRALAEALAELGCVTCVAPHREMSATSHSISLYQPIRYESAGKDRYAVQGTPADCVTLALSHILRERPHLVVSGINRGANLGHNVFYSGTVGAAVEGTLRGVPSIAISVCTKEEFRTAGAAAFAAQLAERVLAEGLPPGVTLNVNVPEEWKGGARITSLGQQIGLNFVKESVDPGGRSYFWVYEETDDSRITPNSDYAAIREGQISVTPLWFHSSEPQQDGLARVLQFRNSVQAF